MQHDKDQQTLPEPPKLTGPKTAEPKLEPHDQHKERDETTPVAKPETGPQFREPTTAPEPPPATLAPEIKEVNLPVIRVGDSTIALRTAEFELAQRKAKAMMASDIIPIAHRGKLGNLILIQNISDRLRMDPLMVAQNIFIIQGRPCWSSSFIIALIRSSGLYKGIRYVMKDLGPAEFKNTKFNDISCQLVAIENESNVEVGGPIVSISMSIKEGWSTKEGSKWINLSDLMLRYRAAAFFARTVCPEVLFGLHSSDEVETMTDKSSLRPQLY